MSRKQLEAAHKIDERTRRTQQRLGNAMVQLIREKPIDEITVQEVLDRAAVGRSTFYLHFSDKEDLLLTQLEEFLELMSNFLTKRKEKSRRVVAVTEMFTHVGGPKNAIYQSLLTSGRLHDFFDLAQGHFERGIRQRIVEIGLFPKLSKPEVMVVAAALAGALLAMFKWWLQHGARETPEKMDELFHQIVWRTT